ncbi:MAG: S1C family serine protease, partial [Desulfobacterales bacterium]
MKFGFLAVLFTVFFTVAANADHSPEHTLKAVVKIRSTVPDSARTARILGTEREGNGVVIDADGLIVTIGYLILEAETIEVYPHEGDPINATYVGYDHKTGFGLLRAEKRINVTPMEIGQSSEVKEGDPILTVGYGGSDSVQGARVVSRREFVGYWEYLLEDALYVAPPHPNYG